MFKLKNFSLENLTSSLEIIYDEKRDKIIKSFFSLTEQFKNIKYGTNSSHELFFLEYTTALDKEITVFSAGDLYAVRLSGIYLSCIYPDWFDNTCSALFFLTKDYQLNINNHSLFSILNFVRRTKFSNKNYQFVFTPKDSKIHSFTHYVEHENYMIVKDGNLSKLSEFSTRYYDKNTHFQVYSNNNNNDFHHVTISLHNQTNLIIKDPLNYSIKLSLHNEENFILKTQDFNNYKIEGIGLDFSYSNIEETIEEIKLIHDNYKLERNKPFIDNLFKHKKEIEEKTVSMFKAKEVSEKDYLDISQMLNTH